MRTLWVCIAAGCLFWGGTVWAAEVDNAPDTQPVDVSVSIFINKIYGVNTLDQTYKVDGDLVAQWTDKPRKTPGDKPLIVENSQVEWWIKNGLWVPALEFINVVGSPDTGNKCLILFPDGRVIYNARFLGAFSNDMDFRQFPFDHQQFVLELEPFSYNNQQLRFSSIKVYTEHIDDEEIDEWEIRGKVATYISDIRYNHLSSVQPNQNDFSRITVQIDAVRNPSHYLWSFILPLGLIIAASWSVFWLESFSERLQTSFTLMLTVVAYAFYTSNILPHLPYTTIIDQMIIAGYGSIFAAILLIIFAHHRQVNGVEDERLIRRCRLVFPLSFLAIGGMLVIRGITL
ncbi:gamma-aminobutyric-acid receptor subunit beta [Dickeya oryzae]|uniref:Gamma-aminobutyric-acid receptor subunit beta n=1 Tax=Dickeya oryzae TaxID=1240404 RepID=A0AB39IMF7_9GAMM|nr:gamma-aminobutyric-acid receptor subunit beta [Dickeya oryzae]MBP2858529.1 gamma-aminobutyric-acid receptor subunit beta [Dickeya oryzae]MCA6990255.1 gamma-aminobutyric-acid receptor subunit beta [Dickeya oryzae]